MVAAYLGYERPVREMAITIDSAAEDAAFADAMRAFGETRHEPFTPASLTGS